MDILQKIAARAVERVAAKKQRVSPEQMREAALSLPVGDFPFEAALRGDDIRFICEIKKASPSKGVIAEDFPYLAIARQYEEAGAAAISVLTEPYFFMGSETYLQEIAEAVSLPLLRKDFTVDEYMIYEAKTLGASAVLLICALLSPPTLAAFIAVAHRLGLSALVEAHNEEEIRMALDAGARVIGVNNRDLKNFAVDMTVSERLRSLVPEETLFVAESGIRGPEDVARLREMGASAALVGETMMRAGDKTAEMRRLLGA